MRKEWKYLTACLFAILAVATIVQGVAKENQTTIFNKLISKLLVLSPHEVACTDTGNPDAAVYSITTPDKAQYQINGTDSDGCRIQLGETGVSDGQILEIINVGSVNVTMTDEAGIAELSGNLTLGAKDTLTLRYDGGSWDQISTSNN